MDWVENWFCEICMWEKEKQKKFDIEGKKLDSWNWILL